MPRKKYADYIKGIGIILVVLGHINTCNDFIKEWIYAFHMPLFFFVTGITTKEIETISLNNATSFLIKKVKSLLVPYMLWGIIYSGYSHQNIISLLYASYSRINDAGSLSSLWFLPTMFLAVCGMEATKALVHRLKFRKSGYVLAISVSIFTSLVMSLEQDEYPFCLNTAFMGLAFIIAGFLFESTISIIVKNRSSNMWFIMAIIGFLGTLTYPFNPIVNTHYVLMANMRIGHPIAFLFTALSGCIMVYAISVLLNVSSKKSKILSFLGKNSLVFFAVHKPVVDICSKCLNAMPLPTGIELLITCTFTLLICSAACMTVNYFAPCLAGKN